MNDSGPVTTMNKSVELQSCINNFLLFLKGRSLLRHFFFSLVHALYYDEDSPQRSGQRPESIRGGIYKR